MGEQQSSGIGAVRTKAPTPGGGRSPQRPGQTPDRSTIPGERRDRSPRVTSLLRPLSQYGTAEEIMQVFRPHGDTWSKEDFEQTSASNEEMRKANPAELTPTRPVPGFALGVSSAVDSAAMLEAGKQGE
jgi:hypothetical protein